MCLHPDDTGLNKFKIINDTKGHQAGDTVLDCMAKILTREFNSRDIIVRFGGDEFMVLMKNIVSEDVVKQKYQNIQEVIRRLSAQNIGSEVDCNDFFRQADDALYHAKEIPGNRSLSPNTSKGKPCHVPSS